MTSTTNNGLAILIGAGPGDAGLLTREGETWLRRCEVVLYDRLANPALLALVPDSAERIFVGKRPDHHAKTQDEINALLVEHTSAGKLVARLKGGDPLIFGRGGEEADALAAAGCKFRIVPGITAAIAAGAYAGISLTDRRCASTLALVTGHEDPTKDESTIDYAALAGIDTVVFYMGIGRLEQIAAKLIESGKSPDTPAALVRCATRPEQTTLTATLGTIYQTAQDAGIRPPALLIVSPAIDPDRRIDWFSQLPLHGQTVAVTRSRTQASRVAREIESLGGLAIEVPTIDIRPAADAEHSTEVVECIGGFDMLVFTSPNGVDHFFATLFELGFDARTLADVEIAVVGPGTAAALEAFGLRADLMPEATFTTAALGETLCGLDLTDKRILLARSDIAPKILPEQLTAAGAIVEDLAIYTTAKPDALPAAAADAFAENTVDWITFSSSSTVDNFLTLTGEQATSFLKATKIASIGPVTSDTLRAAGFEPTLEASPHTIDALIDAIKNYA
ncbi:MAG: uroporphyrinogen-III C-methyltransferase [Phycisphaerales bacterium]|jgi:uroporphyrinogen III methyltransferase / synthase|nr:uroporphyrinogen-III C-methyltransferase [Phycisphaerales bacterium]MBT7171998.1 uroporphyrinogen-III C-methyltransferase [Phycisphaerales bacterium]